MPLSDIVKRYKKRYCAHLKALKKDQTQTFSEFPKKLNFSLCGLPSKNLLLRSENEMLASASPMNTASPSVHKTELGEQPFGRK